MVSERFLTNLEIKSTLLDEIKEAQKNEKCTARIQDKMNEGKAIYFSQDEQGVLWFGNQLVVLKVDAFRKKILEEAHDSFLLHSSGK